MPSPRDIIAPWKKAASLALREHQWGGDKPATVPEDECDCCVGVVEQEIEAAGWQVVGRVSTTTIAQAIAEQVEIDQADVPLHKREWPDCESLARAVQNLLTGAPDGD